MRRLTLIAPGKSDAQRLAVTVLREALLALTPGFSEYQGRGAWRAPDGETVYENHTRFEVLHDDGAAVLCDAVKEVFRAYGRQAGESTLLWWEDYCAARFEEVKHDAERVAG